MRSVSGRVRDQGWVSMLPRTAVTGAILLEGGEDFGGADVAGVEDAVGALEGGEGFGAEQAVGVGDEAEEHRH